MKTSQVRVNGYPPLDLVLSHFNAIPILIEAVKKHCPATVLHDWDRARNATNPNQEVQVLVGIPSKGTDNG